MLQILTGIIAITIGLAVFQDYLSSQLQNTGFYISESLLYNCIWLFLLPLTLIDLTLFKLIGNRTKPIQAVFALLTAGTLTILHIVVFALFFVLVSYFAFSPTHHFSIIFSSAFSNQFYILFLFYLIVPISNQFIQHEKKIKRNADENMDKIRLKIGSRLLSIQVDTIHLITTDKPYSLVYTDENKYMDDRSLKEFGTLLNTADFLRVHRSYLINASYISQLKSRKNGDYDAVLKNGYTVRFSRHYRNNWKHLLH